MSRSQHQQNLDSIDSILRVNSEYSREKLLKKSNGLSNLFNHVHLLISIFIKTPYKETLFFVYCQWFMIFSLFILEFSENNMVITLILLEEIADPKCLADAYVNLAIVSMCQRLWDEAIHYHQKHVEIRKEIDNPVLTEWAKLWLGRAYMKKGDYAQATKIFYEFADRIFEFQDDYKQSGLFQTLEPLEYVYRSLNKRNEFLDFCKSYRDKHAESVKELPLRQWYLEPEPISEKYSNLAFADDFDNKTLDSSWSWLNPLDDCSYGIVTTDQGQKGLQISAVNGRDLSGLNLSAPRFIREVTGDFAVQVCILSPSEDKPQMGGLLIWKDESNYLCLCKGGSDRYGFQFYGYFDKKQLMAGRGYLSDENDEKVYHRLERSGDIFSAYVSADGVNWLTCGKLTMKIDDPIHVGIYTYGMIDRTVYCGEYREGCATAFREFRIFKMKGDV